MSFFENFYFNNIATRHLHYVAAEAFGEGESHWPSLQTVKKKGALLWSKRKKESLQTVRLSLANWAHSSSLKLSHHLSVTGAQCSFWTLLTSFCW